MKEILVFILILSGIGVIRSDPIKEPANSPEACAQTGIVTTSCTCGTAGTCSVGSTCSLEANQVAASCTPAACAQTGIVTTSCTCGTAGTCSVGSTCSLEANQVAASCTPAVCPDDVQLSEECLCALAVCGVGNTCEGGTKCTPVFIDIMAMGDKKKIQDDKFRQDKFKEEAEKLFQFAIKQSGFNLKNLEDILEENVRMKRQVQELEINSLELKINNLEQQNDDINNKLIALVDKIDIANHDIMINNRGISLNSASIGDNKVLVHNNKKQLDTNIETLTNNINTHTNNINTNKNNINTHTHNINTNKNNINNNNNKINNANHDITTNSQTITALTDLRISYCGVRSPMSTTGTITYSSLLTNINTLNTVGLDIATGVFTAPTGGTYSVSINYYTLGTGRFDVFPYRNGQLMDELWIYSRVTDGNIDNAGRTFTTELDTHDTIHAQLDTLTGSHIYRITFCVTYTK